jgi:endonuclease III
MTDKKIKYCQMTKDEIAEFFKLLEKQNPQPKCELEFKTPFTLMVAIILSAQSTDKGVNKATKPLFEQVRTPEQMLNLGEEGLRGYVKTLNYFNMKTKHIIELSKVLKEKYNGALPRSFDELIQLPGVGRKTANVFLNVLEDAPLIAVDTHVFRVANRIGLAQGKKPLDIEEGLKKIVPDEYKSRAQHWLVLLGRYTCKAQKPLCATCPVYKVCRFSEKTVLPEKEKN